MKNTAIALALSFSTLTANAFTNQNHPNFFEPSTGRQFSYNFDSLPSEGRLTLDQMPWSSSYWPDVYGGIAFRWHYWIRVASAPFSQMHLDVYGIEDRMKEVREVLFDTATSNSARISLKSELDQLTREKQDLENRKARYYRNLFFSRRDVGGKREVRRMSRQDMRDLSPAEKYDLYMGNYDLKLTKQILGDTAPTDPYWEGVCNGWSSAAIEFHEPRSTTVRNKDGIDIEFGSSDLKALASFYHWELNRAGLKYRGFYNDAFVGTVCGTKYSLESWHLDERTGNEYYYTVNQDGSLQRNPVPAECLDTDAGAFHVVAANYLGRFNKAFNAEVVVDDEIWNQPVYGFESEVIERGQGRSLFASKNAGVAEQVKVKAKLHYANDGGSIFWGTDDPTDEFYAWWNPTNGTSNYRGEEKEFEYVLDLSSDGKIIGGNWLSYERPDFLWIKTNKGFIQNGRRRFNRSLGGYLNEGLSRLLHVR